MMMIKNRFKKVIITIPRVTATKKLLILFVAVRFYSFCLDVNGMKVLSKGK